MASRVFISPLFLFAISILSSYFNAISASQTKSKEFVLTLDHSNFNQTVSKHKLIVVEFYAPWCGHCKTLAPEYEKAASVLNNHDPPIVLAKVDASNKKNKILGDKFDIKGFPTLKIFRNGGKIIQDYKGTREADGIVAYLKKQSGPPSFEIRSTEDASTLIKNDTVVIVGVFPELSGEKFEIFTALADKLRPEYEFRHTLDARILPRGDLSISGPTVRLFKPFDEQVVDFQDFNLEALEKFVNEAGSPIVTYFDKDPKNHPFVLKFFSGPSNKALLFLNMSSEVVDAYKPKYHDVAKQYKGTDLSFLMGDIEASLGIFQYFGLKESQLPLVTIQNKDGRMFLKSNIEPDQIASWIKDYKDGNVQPYVKSEPIPEANNEPVKVVVADSFQDIVINSEKNVLLEFYAPWCGHCKKLAPILDEVGVSFENDVDVIVAKMDATANDYPEKIFPVKGYPTLYFKSASGNLLQYRGNRTKEDIVEFIQNHRDKDTQQSSVKDEL